MCSAIALEASLPDWMTMPRRMSITVAWPLIVRYMHDSVLEPRHQAFSLSVWSATGNTVTRVAQTLATRRTGRLRWREIVGPAREDPP